MKNTSLSTSHDRKHTKADFLGNQVVSFYLYSVGQGWGGTDREEKAESSIFNEGERNNEGIKNKRH